MPRRKSPLLKHPIFLLSLASVVLFTPFQTQKEEVYLLMTKKGKGISMYKGDGKTYQPEIFPLFGILTPRKTIKELASNPTLTQIVHKKKYVEGSAYSRVRSALKHNLKSNILNYLRTPDEFKAWADLPHLYFITEESQYRTINTGDKEHDLLYKPFKEAFIRYLRATDEEQ